MQAQQKALAFLKSIEKNDFRMDLAPIREVARRLNSPQNRYRVIHIAGTNGKGSTAAFLESILRNSGLRVGLMTSPHLVTPLERIQINRENISWKKLWEITQKIERSFDSAPLSYFEMMVLAGFQYFAEEKIDIAVVETGMGGRLDATKIVNPEVAILTPISFDHQQYLGNSLEKIAIEKCGIIKTGTTVVSAPQHPEIIPVIESICKKQNAKLIWADPSTITTSLGLAGEHQKINAACAVAAASFYGGGGVDHALAQTSWPGRLQYLHRKPDILIDGAHNEAGIAMLQKFLQQQYPSQKINFIFGVLQDKNWETLFDPLLSMAKKIICVTPHSPRALPAKKLAEHFKQKAPVPVEICEVFSQKLLNALRSEEQSSSKNKKSPIVISGSLYLISEVLLGS